MLGSDGWRDPVDAGRAHKRPGEFRCDIVEARDAMTPLGELGEPVQQLHDPPEALRRQRTTDIKLARHATDHVGQGLPMLLRMLAHVGTSHKGAGHGPGGVCAPAGAT